MLSVVLYLTPSHRNILVGKTLYAADLFHLFQTHYVLIDFIDDHLQIIIQILRAFELFQIVF